MNFISGIAAANAQRGVEVTVLANARFDPALLPGVRVVPLFTKTWVQSYSEASTALRLLACLTHNLLDFCVLWKYLARSGEFDCVIATHVNVFNLIAWKLLSVTRLGKANLLLDSVAPLWVFKYQDEKLTFIPQAKFSRIVYRLFKSRAANPRCQVAAESEHDAELLSRWSGTQVISLPTPRSPVILEEIARSRQQEALGGRGADLNIRLAWLGRGTLDRGFPLFVEAVERLVGSASGENLRFVVQLFDSTGRLRLEEKRIIDLAAKTHAVRIVAGELVNEEYARMLSAVDCLVLPYVKEEYIGRNSSLAQDAFACGVPIIATEGTWMAEEMKKRGAGLTIRDGNLDDLIQVIGEFRARAEELKRVARLRAEEVRRENSWDRFLEILWGSSQSLDGVQGNRGEKSFNGDADQVRS